METDRPKGLKIDLHVHTCYSGDSLTTLRELIAYSKVRGLDGVAVTDHDTVEGALNLLGRAGIEGLIIIPGIEVSTSMGHVLGLNITTPIPKGLDPAETVERIHEAGGIAVEPHPPAPFKSSLGTGDYVSQLGLDAIEVINSSVVPFSLMSLLSRRLAERLNLPQTAGSDSHLPEAIGLAYILIDVDPDVEEIIEGIRRGKAVPYGKPIPWGLRLKKIIRRG